MAAKAPEKFKKTPEEIEQEKQARFKALATKRVNLSILATRKLTLLANQGSYSYTDDQVNIIEDILTKERDRAIAALRARVIPKESEYTI